MSRKQKGRIARWTSLISFLFALGTVGGMEQFSITPLRGVVYIILSLSLCLAAGLKGGLFR